MKKPLLIIISTALAAVVCLYVYVTPSILSSQGIPVSSAIATNTGQQENGAASTAPAVPSSANVTLAAGTTTYAAHIDGSKTVIELMRSLPSSGFVFSGDEYPSLGYFVESINGKKNGDGKYWILYINGKPSDLGASNATIHAGDTVEWRFEKSY
ncbi:MAG: DUF4430 domain-containing protein [Patescibacteria group bacterium]